MSKPNALSLIAAGWKNLVWPDKEVEKVARERAEICAKCPLLVSMAGKGICCYKCGCVIAAKVRSLDESCPVGKWRYYVKPNQS